MPFDFRMKHAGEPPARHLAAVKIEARARGFHPRLAEVLAPVLETPEDMESVSAAIESMYGMLKIHSVAEAEGVALIEQAIKEHIAEAGAAAGKEEDEDADIEASARFQSHDPSSKTLSGRLYKLLNSRNGPKVRINGRGPSVNRIGSDGAKVDRQIEDALLARMDRRHKPTIGADLVGMRASQWAMAWARAQGLRPDSERAALRMALGGSHTTSDFPGIFANSLGKMLAREMEQAAPAILRAAHHIPASDYYPGNMVALSASGMPQKVNEAGEIHHVTIDERGEAKPVPDTFAALFRASHKMFIQDDLGILTQIGVKMAQGAVERQRRVLLDALEDNAGLGNLMADGKPVFHADHGNRASTGSALDVDSLGAARTAQRTQKGKQGEIYNIEPWALMVPPALETTAQKVLAEIDATKISDVNPFGGQLELIVEPGLASASAWYLIGDPGRYDGLAWSSLEGEGPRVESKPGWETLGMDFRLVWDLDARFVHYASWFKNPGA